MYRTYFFIPALLLSVLLRAQSSSDLSLDDYIFLNNQETRLLDFKDSDNDLAMKIHQLKIINTSRRRFRADPVKLDILASRVANKMCREAALNAYVGHWNLSGEKPYHRYASAGGLDHVSENASGQSTTGVFSTSMPAILKMMENNHYAFMNEKRPYDGHKQNIINKHHNYVGLGFYVAEQESRYYELFIDRYYAFGKIPESLSPGDSFTMECQPQQGHHINLIIAYYEPHPKSLTPRQINRRSYYDDYSDEIAFQIAPWETKKYRSGNNYHFPLSFEKPGLYYIQIFSDPRPYRDGTKYSSEGALQASGVVIRVANK